VAVSRIRDARGRTWLLGAGALGVAVTSAWPYFDVTDLLTDTDAGFANRQMYQDVVLRLFPAAAIGLWGIWRRARSDRRDLLGLMLVGAFAIYAYGYVRDEYTYGRSLALVVIVLGVAAGDGVARLEGQFGWRRASPWVRAGAAALGALLVLGLVNTRSGLVRMVPSALLPESVRTSDAFRRVDDQYGFLSRFVDGDEVVIGTTDQDNRVVPAIAGQPLRPFWKAPAPPDADGRAAAQAVFLDPATTSARRAEIQARYNVRFLLVHPREDSAASLLRVLESDGANVVYRGDGIQLVALPAPGRS
jgi:hypothetical protein